MRFAHSDNQQHSAYLDRTDQNFHCAPNAAIRAGCDVGSLVATDTAGRALPWDCYWNDAVENGQEKVRVAAVGIVVIAGIGSWVVIVVGPGWQGRMVSIGHMVDRKSKC